MSTPNLQRRDFIKEHVSAIIFYTDRKASILMLHDLAQVFMKTLVHQVEQKKSQIFILTT